MVNFPVMYDLMAQHRQQLLAEAECDRLAKQALAGATPVTPATPATLPTHCVSGDSRLSVLTRVLLALHRPAAAPAGTGPAEATPV
jgi:hypothetical protein